MKQFETVTCSRCGGSGKYSYCQMYGDTCFKCRGKGIVFTKRGQVAYDVYVASLKKRADELKPGDRVSFVSGIWNTVKETGIGIGGNCSIQIIDGVETRVPFFDIITEGYSSSGQPGEMIRVAFNKESKTTKWNAALAYQDTLTKAGKPRKRKAPVN